MSVSSYPMPVVLLLALLSQQALAADDENKGEETAKEPPPCKYCPDYSGWSDIGEGYSCAALNQKAHQGQTAFPGPDNNNSFILIILFHRNFNVDKAINASTMLIIQKRTIIFGSGQPFNSK